MVVNPCEQPDLKLFAEHRSDHCASSPKIGLNRPVFLNQIHRKSFLLGHTFGCFFHQLKIYVDSFFSPSENLSNRMSCNQRYIMYFLPFEFESAILLARIILLKNFKRIIIFILLFCYSIKTSLYTLDIWKVLLKMSVYQLILYEPYVQRNSFDLDKCP